LASFSSARKTPLQVRYKLAAQGSRDSVLARNL